MGASSRGGLREQILRAAKADPSATHAQIAQRVGCHVSTAAKHLKGRRPATTPRAMGRAKVSLGKTLALAGEDEDIALSNRMTAGPASPPPQPLGANPAPGVVLCEECHDGEPATSGDPRQPWQDILCGSCHTSVGYRKASADAAREPSDAVTACEECYGDDPDHDWMGTKPDTESDIVCDSCHTQIGYTLAAA